MKTPVLILVAGFAFGLSADVLEVDVATSQDGYTSGQQALIDGGTITEIRKIGAGTLISKGIASFTGTVRVTNGVFQVSDATGLGSSAGETIVERGATLHFSSLSSGYTTYKSERYTIAGNGYNTSSSQTNGAIRITGATCQLSHITMSDDAAVYSSMGFHFYDDGTSGIDMKGKTLALLSSASGNLDVEFKLDGIDNPGNIEIYDARYFRPYSMPFSGGASHEVRLFGRAGVLLDNTTENKAWTIARYGAGGFYQYGSSGTWDGPVENRNLVTPMSMSVGAGKKLTFNGPVRGSGAFMKDANAGWLVLNATNTFTSVFEAKGGMVILGCPEAAAGSIVDRFNFSNLTVDLGLTGKTANWERGWTTVQIKDAIDACTAASKANVSVSLHARSGDEFVADPTFSGDYSAIRLGAINDGTVSYAATLAGNPKFTVSTDADLVFTKNPEQEGDNTLGAVSVIKGFLSFKDAGFINMGGTTISVGANRSTTLMGVKVSGSTVLGHSASGAGEIGLPNSVDLRGVYMEVGEGAVVTNRLQFSIGSTASSGALYLRGGEVYTPYSGTYLGYLGGRGHGYIELSNGLFQVQRWLHLGMFQSGAGQLAVKAGEFRVLESPFYVGEAGTGIVYQTGGKIRIDNDLYVPSSAFENDKTTGFGVYTVSGGTAETEVTGNAVVNNRAYGTGILNLNGGGVFKASKLYKSSSCGATAKAYVNFNGGVLKATADSTNLLGNVSGDKDSRPDAVTVYSGGAVVDTDGHSVAISAPLVAPTGGGISSITLNGTLPDIVHPPVITIAGDGQGASAVATFDSTTRTVTGIDVTSPGCGYTAANTTINANYRGYPGTNVSCSFGITDQTGSAVKLTKRGEGTLTLASGVLPADAAVTVEGGSIGGEGLVFSEMTVDLDVAAGGSYGTISAWPAGAKLKITNLGILDKDIGSYTLMAVSSGSAIVPELDGTTVIPPPWKLVANGPKLMLVYSRGLVVIYR